MKKQSLIAEPVENLVHTRRSRVGGFAPLAISAHLSVTRPNGGIKTYSVPVKNGVWGTSKVWLPWGRNVISVKTVNMDGDVLDTGKKIVECRKETEEEKAKRQTLKTHRQPFPTEFKVEDIPLSTRLGEEVVVLRKWHNHGGEEFPVFTIDNTNYEKHLKFSAVCWKQNYPKGRKKRMTSTEGHAYLIENDGVPSTQSPNDNGVVTWYKDLFPGFYEFQLDIYSYYAPTFKKGTKWSEVKFSGYSRSYLMDVVESDVPCSECST